MQLWFEKDPELLKVIEQEVEDNFPGLIVFRLGNKIVIKGRLDVYFDQTLYDTYGVYIELADNHPYSTPSVYETDGRLPKTLDRHFHGDDKSACLFVPFEKKLYWKNLRSIAEFIGGPVNAFFYAQSFYDKNNYFPYGDRSHDLKGVIESIKEHGKIENTEQVLSFLEFLRTSSIKGHLECPCGSGKKNKNCHQVELIHLKGLLSDTRMIQFIQNWIGQARAKEIQLLRQLGRLR